MRNAIFIAWHDLRIQMRQGSTLVWVFLMPPVFFYFIGTLTGSISGNAAGDTATPIVVAARMPGLLRDQVDMRLRQNDFEPDWQEEIVADADGSPPRRVLSISDNFSDRLMADQVVTARFDTKASALSRDFEIIRVQRSLYTALADIVTADASSHRPLDATALYELNNAPRVWQLDVAPAGKRQETPSGFGQAIPGMLVMFTLLVLLTSGTTLLVADRKQGLLRRLAYAPISRAEIVAGKWGSRMALAAMQIIAAVAIGTVLFDMDWGPDIGMVAVVLAAWAAFCASGGLLLGSLVKTEAQASGIGTLTANVLAALGGCWWPIEVTPQWMQSLQNFLPTGWTMDALHKLISFEAGAAAAVPYVITLVFAALVTGWFAVRRFQYE